MKVRINKRVTLSYRTDSVERLDPEAFDAKEQELFERWFPDGGIQSSDHHRLLIATLGETSFASNQESKFGRKYGVVIFHLHVPLKHLPRDVSGRIHANSKDHRVRWTHDKVPQWMFYAARSCCLEMGVELQIEKGPPYDFFQVARESEKVGMCVLEVMMVYSGNTYDSAKPEYLLKSVARHFRKHIPLWVR